MPNEPQTPEILSEEALTETEARLSRSVELDLLPDVRALCQTVRALESALRKANEIVEEAVHKNARLQLDNAALRDQLAQVKLRITDLENETAKNSWQVDV